MVLVRTLASKTVLMCGYRKKEVFLARNRSQDHFACEHRWPTPESMSGAYLDHRLASMGMGIFGDIVWPGIGTLR